MMRQGRKPRALAFLFAHNHQACCAIIHSRRVAGRYGAPIAESRFQARQGFHRRIPPRTFILADDERSLFLLRNVIGRISSINFARIHGGDGHGDDFRQQTHPVPLE